MARTFLSGIQVPTLPKLNIDGELTLDSSAGTSGQVLTSAGAGATPTWTTVGGSYTLPTATSTVLGGIELFSDTAQSVAANSVSATASRTYGLQLNAAGQAVVNVPWSDTDTNTFPTTWTWTAGTTSGPTASITGTSSTISVAAIPVANGTSASGVVTTGAQTFGGIKSMTSPAITTSITTPTTGTFDLINTTATTVNFAGAATTLNIGNTATGAQTVNMFTASTGASTYNFATGANNTNTKTINIGTGGTSTSTTVINIGPSTTSSSTINLQGPFIKVGRVTSSTSSITGVNTSIAGASTSTSGASASVNGGHLLITGGPAAQEDEFNTAAIQGGSVYIDGGATSTINGVVTKGTVFVGTTTDTRTVTIGRTGITTTVNGTLSNSGNTTTTGSLTRSALVGGGSTTATFDNSGNLIRTTSSERYKQDIADAEYLYSDVLALEPKTFRLKNEVEQDEDARFYGGFIAEDVDQLNSLKPFVNYLTKEDGDKIPDGIQYGEMVAALVSAIKHQNTIIEDLKARIVSLENN